MRTGGSQGKGRVEIVRYKANGSVVLRRPAPSNGYWPRISMPEGKKWPCQTHRWEVDSLA